MVQFKKGVSTREILGITFQSKEGRITLFFLSLVIVVASISSFSSTVVNQGETNSFLSEASALLDSISSSSNASVDSSTTTASNLRVATTTTTTASTVSDDFDSEENSRQLKAWRQSIREECQAAQTFEDVMKIDVLNSQGFHFPDPSTLPKRPSGPTLHDEASQAPYVKRCHRVVLDFGANIGDTSGHVIDTGMIPCERLDLGKTVVTEPTHFDVVETKRFTSIPKRNALTRNLESLMQSQNDRDSDETTGGSSSSSNNLGPEDYCYYGVEGNPVFTERLQLIEDTVMAIRPRPIQHMHFFTESVGAGADGMTKLYLDTVNTEQNYWGSSIFQDHQDVRKSIDQANGNIATIAADVMGYTIGSIMRKTLSAFGTDPNTPKVKNHLILKVDIEGGEYPLLNQAVEDGTLCQFVQDGNTADVFIEFHSQRVTGKHDLSNKAKYMKEHLMNCGVTFGNLQAWWH